jgi:hypothetical protein
LKANEVEIQSLTVEDDEIVLLTRHDADAEVSLIVSELVPLVTQLGLLEFVDFSGLGDDLPQAGDCILTTAIVDAYGETFQCPVEDQMLPILTPIAREGRRLSPLF